MYKKSQYRYYAVLSSNLDPIILVFNQKHGLSL